MSVCSTRACSCVCILRPDRRLPSFGLHPEFRLWSECVRLSDQCRMQISWCECATSRL
jgi:hypothetical protein